MEGFKKNWEKRSGRSLWGGGGSTPPSQTASICENFDPFLSFIKWQNNPQYDNLSRNFYIYLTASGEGRVWGQPKHLTAFSQFFLTPSLSIEDTWKEMRQPPWAIALSV